MTRTGPRAASRDAAILIDRNVVVPMRDGTVLRCDVWRPGDGKRHPALVQRTPYGKELAAAEGASGFYSTPQLVCAGYAVVVQDTRGRHASAGTWGGLTQRAWDREARDTYDTVEWAGTQPWCEGGVGLFGASYPGVLCWLGAGQQPPHLRAIAPMLVGRHEEAHLDTGGAFWLHTWISWYLNGLLADVPRLRAQGAASEAQIAKLTELAWDPSPITEQLPLADCADFDLPGMPVTLAEVLNGSAVGWPAFPPAGQLTVPALLVAGYYDFYVVRMIEQFRELRAGAGPERGHRLILGPWTHDTAGPLQGELFLPPDACGLGSVQPAMVTFFDKHLKNGTQDLPPVQYFVLGENRWKTAGAWPHGGTRVMSWYLHSSGTADAGPDHGAGTLSTDRPAAGETPDRYRYDPADPVRTLGGRVAGNIVGSGAGGPRDQARLAGRRGLLAYRSAPLTGPLLVSGYSTVHVYAASSAVDTDFVAKFVDVEPGGRELLVLSGLARARFRKGAGQEVLLEPGAIEKYEINLGPIAMRIPAGHRIGLYLCSSDFPWFDRNMNTGDPLGTRGGPVVAEQTVFHDPAYPSRLDICVIHTAGNPPDSGGRKVVIDDDQLSFG